MLETLDTQRKNKQLPITHVWQKLGGWCIPIVPIAIGIGMTMTTKYKSGNGLTPSAAKRPAFPGAKRYYRPETKRFTW